MTQHTTGNRQEATKQCITVREDTICFNRENLKEAYNEGYLDGKRDCERGFTKGRMGGV